MILQLCRYSIALAVWRREGWGGEEEGEGRKRGRGGGGGGRKKGDGNFLR